MNGNSIVITDQALAGCWFAPIIRIVGKHGIKQVDEVYQSLPKSTELRQIFVPDLNLFTVRKDSPLIELLMHGLSDCIRELRYVSTIYLILSGDCVRRANTRGKTATKAMIDGLKFLQNKLLLQCSPSMTIMWCGFLNPGTLGNVGHRNDYQIQNWMLWATKDPRVIIQDFAWDMTRTDLFHDCLVTSKYKRKVCERISEEIGAYQSNLKPVFIEVGLPL